MIWNMKISLKTILAFVSVSKKLIRPSIKYEDDVSEGCTLAVKKITGQFFNLYYEIST